MILDALAKFADAQESTVSVASTDVVNTLAGGDAYVGNWFVARVDTAFTAGAGTPTAIFQLQTAETEDFSGATPITLVQSSAYVASQLTAGKFWAVRIPPGVKKYLRGYKLSNENGDTTKWTTGKWDMFITHDIDLEINKRYLLQ